VPVVRKTGGLADTVFDADHSGLGLEGANGFVFEDANPAGLDSALSRAIGCWYEAPDSFAKIAQNGMRYDYSWKNPAHDYENIYNYIKAK
jgi:starch synthase